MSHEKARLINQRRLPQRERIPKKKDQGHEFTCVPLSVSSIFNKCLNNDPEQMKIVEELRFGAFRHLPLYYLKHKVLKQIFNCFDPYDHTIHAVAGDVEITTEKIGEAFGLKYTGTTYLERVISKDLNDRDYTVFKYFQGIKQAALKNLIFNTPVDTDENRDLFKRAFLLYLQKCFFLPTSAPNISPRALPTIFNLKNTRHQN
ncbi:hypothetical protein PIB30_007859 [Stylosanthes scabra]|uniref:Aminotransferase-like plant mobile domain-containing protein n=1 Tax=Stylosanthes scabra TaxID=79078 RepID=A0ABU6R6J0_9FABA|nr:hypothetical protein [Stylosanthes scabra]